MEWYSITADVWSIYRKSYMGMTIHWIDEGMEKRTAPLALRRIRGTIDFKALGEEMHRVFLRYGLSVAKMTHLTTDNGSNFTKACKEYGVDLDALAVDAEDVPMDDVEEEEPAPVEFVLDNVDIHLPKQQRCACHSLSLVATTDLDKVKQYTLYIYAEIQFYFPIYIFNRQI